ncbi:MAG: hypothetical protein RIS57_653, partial [Actinomycetota bacterium]
TEAMIEKVCPIDSDSDLEEIRVSGSLTRHYSPRARVVIDRNTNTGEGLIAFSEVATPEGVIRLSSPESVEDYARSLYSSLRKGDSQGLSVIVVIPPSGDGLAAAIRDRIMRASAH